MYVTRQGEWSCTSNVLNCQCELDRLSAVCIITVLTRDKLPLPMVQKPRKFYIYWISYKTWDKRVNYSFPQLVLFISNAWGLLYNMNFGNILFYNSSYTLKRKLIVDHTYMSNRHLLVSLINIVHFQWFYNQVLSELMSKRFPE